MKHIEEKVNIGKKPEDPENVQEFEKIITNNKKSSLVSVPSRYNIPHFKEAYENNSRHLQTKSLRILINKNIYFKFNRFPLFIMINFLSSSF